MEGKLYFSLFNKLCVQLEKSSLTLESQKIQELLSYLLLHRDRPHSREILANMLWSDIPLRQSKRYLRKALWQLQSTLGNGKGAANCNILLVDADWIQINPQSEYWLDIALFEQSFDVAQGMPGRELSSANVQKLKEAVALYRGDLLDGYYQEWCIFERERLQHMYLIILDKLMDYCETHGDYEAGQDFGTCILRYDNARERTHRRLMRLHYLAGNRTEALRQFDRCVEILQKELSVKPAKRTLLLYERICADKVILLDKTALEESAEPDDAEATLADIVEQLKKLQMEMFGIQEQMRQKIETAESILNNSLRAP